MEIEDPGNGPWWLTDGNSIEVSDSALSRAEPITKERGARRSHRRMLAVGTGLTAAVAMSILLVGVGGPGSKDASAQVMKGALATLSQRTVAINISGTISANGQSFDITGSGVADLSSNLETTTLSFHPNGTSVQETFLANGPAAYMQIVENGQNGIAQLLPGKDWVQYPLGVASTSGVGAGAPNMLAQLQLLAAKGNAVVGLGSSTINGEAVTGYQVTITKQAMTAAYKRAEALGGAEAPAIKTMLQSVVVTPPVIKIWLDANHLLRREKVSMNLAVSGNSVAGDVQMDFADYGRPVTVSIPAQSETATYSAFLAAAAAAS